jgi:hypothetical protein
MEVIMSPMPGFFFRFYRFVGPREARTTELVRSHSEADGMRTLIDQSEATVKACIQRVSSWATANGVAVAPADPFPSSKHPGKVWLEFRFGGLTL